MDLDIRIDILQQSADRIGDQGMVIYQQNFHRMVEPWFAVILARIFYDRVHLICR
jgi:hypothetical protein